MDHEPLTRWSCDRCGGPVVVDQTERESDRQGGYVNWDDGVAPKIFHKFGCQDDSLHASAPISEFVGSDGLAFLTSMLGHGRLRAHHHGPTPPGHFDFSNDMDAFVDFFRRVQLPHYEEARMYMLTREGWDTWHDGGELSPYLQHNLARMQSTTEDDE